MFAFKSFKFTNNDKFFSVEFLDKAFDIFNDMKELQKWVYEMTLTHKPD